MPPARDAGLHDIGGEFVGSGVECLELLGGADTPSHTVSLIAAVAAVADVASVDVVDGAAVDVLVAGDASFSLLCTVKYLKYS